MVDQTIAQMKISEAWRQMDGAPLFRRNEANRVRPMFFVPLVQVVQW
jgi:hypothetical protein